MIEVALDPYEHALAQQAGTDRRKRALRLGLHEAHGYDGDEGMELMRRGARTEMAAAKALGIYWPPLGHLPWEHQPDVGPYQVRSALRLRRLRVHADEPDDDLYVFVVEAGTEYQVYGAITAAEVKARGEWRGYGGRPPCYWLDAELADLGFVDAAGHHVVICRGCLERVAFNGDLCSRCYLRLEVHGAQPGLGLL